MKTASKTNTRILACCAAIVCLAVACPTLAPVAAAQAVAAKPASGSKVTVTVNGVMSDAGTVRGQLCADSGLFGVTECPPYRVTVPAKTGSVILVFENVPPGTYAFSAWHDENGDTKTQVFSEPLAFGNESRSLPPVFDEAAFKVTGDMTSSTTLFRITG
jgi:uncharacterized protein (DUF2141 family)